VAMKWSRQYPVSRPSSTWYAGLRCWARAGCAVCAAAVVVQPSLLYSQHDTSRVDDRRTRLTAQSAGDTLTIVKMYDAERRKMLIHLGPAPVRAEMLLSLLVTMDGVRPVEAPDAVMATFWSLDPEQRYAESRRVFLWGSDSSAVDIGAAYLVGNPRPGFTEVLIVAVPFEVFEEFLDQGASRVMVGEESFPLSAEWRGALRDLSGCVRELLEGGG